MLSKKVLAGIMGLSFMFVGCGKAKEKVGEALDRDVDIVGTWRTDNTEVGLVDALPNAERSFDFGATGNFSRVEKFCDDDKCSNGEGFVYELEGSYETKGESKENNEVKVINFTVDHAYITVKNELAVDAFAAIELCGIKNWEENLNKKVEITDKSCAGFNVKKGDVVVDVYDVSDKKLFLGKALSFSLRDDSDDRPTDVDRDLVYNKR